MASHKLILEDDYQEEFSLIAIHCSEEPYKMAYILNKHLSLRLSRDIRMLLVVSNEYNALKTREQSTTTIIFYEIIDVDVAELQFAHLILICGCLL